MKYKNYLIILAVLFTLIPGFLLLVAYDEESAKALMKRASFAWELDVEKFRSVGVHSWSGGIIVRRWERSEGDETHTLEVTFEDGLVCYFKINNNSQQYHHFGCMHFPE
jgi:hypothetical protein